MDTLCTIYNVIFLFRQDHSKSHEWFNSSIVGNEPIWSEALAVPVPECLPSLHDCWGLPSFSSDSCAASTAMWYLKCDLQQNNCLFQFFLFYCQLYDEGFQACCILRNGTHKINDKAGYGMVIQVFQLIGPPNKLINPANIEKFVSLVLLYEHLRHLRFCVITILLH